MHVYKYVKINITLYVMASKNIAYRHTEIDHAFVCPDGYERIKGLSQRCWKEYLIYFIEKVSKPVFDSTNINAFYNFYQWLLLFS